MGLQYNGTNIYGINYNGVALTQLNFNGVPVWYALAACTISGEARIGKTWLAKTTPPEVQDLCTYQWYRGNTLISGATDSAYETVEGDRGYQLKCVAKIGSASAESGFSSTILQDVTGLTISGVTEEGYSLSAEIIPEGATGAYQWYRGDSIIEGATNSTYTLVHADAKNYITCKFVADGNYIGSVEDTTTTVITGLYSWSQSISNSNSMSTSVSASYTIPEGITCTKITCYASAYNHTAQGETEIANATAEIYVNGSRVAKGSTAESGPGGWCESSTSKSGTWGEGTQVELKSVGSTWKRKVSGTLSGTQKG